MEKSISEKMRETEDEIRQLKNRQKVLLNKKTVEERKARAHRLIQRGAMLESVFPSVVPMKNEDIMTLLSHISRLPEVLALLPKTPETGDAR